MGDVSDQLRVSPPGIFVGVIIWRRGHPRNHIDTQPERRARPIVPTGPTPGVQTTDVMNWPELIVAAILGAAVPAVAGATWLRFRSWRDKVQAARLPAVVTAYMFLNTPPEYGPQVSLVNEGPGVAKEVDVEVVRALSPGAMPSLAPKTRDALTPGQFDWWPMPLEDDTAKVVEVRVRWVDGHGRQERTQTLDASAG